jgi:D-sedoheptulose 7-phosphate isomerase
MLEQRIQQQLFESADLLNAAAESLSRPLASAVEAVAACITSGGKLWVAGSGTGAHLAPVLVTAFVGRFERERPPLAAALLRDDPQAALSQQVSALCQPGDLLLLVDGGVDSEVLAAAAAAGHGQEASLIVLAGGVQADWGERLHDTDVLLRVPAERPARVAEIQLLVLHGLCDAVDLQLMGEQESE